MAEKLTATQKWAAKNKKKTTADDMIGNGMAKKAASAIQSRKQRLDDAIEGYTVNGKKVK